MGWLTSLQPYYGTTAWYAHFFCSLIPHHTTAFMQPAHLSPHVSCPGGTPFYYNFTRQKPAQPYRCSDVPLGTCLPDLIPLPSSAAHTIYTSVPSPVLHPTAPCLS
ncbi:unnamed protein product [Chondrus crispus]|uniref:Uncharacterized protein n=1 Tax=Chondrus crispus TaxID=2769 RepID=R7QJB6_CHOCR|nr:unnamed protein product [Chondrus crispus]CDF38194.1 unnamed protein product [Chondrus crispus]|eukprot:XP_005718063.1 unnamed protein product [Chondrus crispus]